MTKRTIQQFAAANGVCYGTARGVIDLLITKGVAKKVKEQSRPVGGMGRGLNLFEMPDKVVMELV